MCVSCVYLVFFLAVFLLCYVVFHLVFFGTVSGFELTEQMQRDEYMVVTCQTYKLNNTDCNEVYGGVPFP